MLQGRRHASKYGSFNSSCPTDIFPSICSLVETVVDPDDGSSSTFFCPVVVFLVPWLTLRWLHWAGQQDPTGAAGSPVPTQANPPTLSKRIIQEAPSQCRAPINNEEGTKAAINAGLPMSQTRGCADVWAGDLTGGLGPSYLTAGNLRHRVEGGGGVARWMNWKIYKSNQMV